MIEINIDAEALDRALQSELERLAAFTPAMAQELTNWQREDMHRHYPNTTEDETSAETDIWPRSRLTEQEHAQQRQARRLTRYPAMRRARGTASRLRGAAPGHSTRPILRPELFDRLDERMVDLMVEKLGWE